MTTGRVTMTIIATPIYIPVNSNTNIRVLSIRTIYNHTRNFLPNNSYSTVTMVIHACQIAALKFPPNFKLNKTIHEHVSKIALKAYGNKCVNLMYTNQLSS
jgi:hypothetical protein